MDIDITKPLSSHISFLIAEFYNKLYEEERYSNYFKKNLTPEEVADITKKDYEEYLQKRNTSNDDRKPN